jgi:peptidoglycan/LPS O-acetylase OafA/YrhL
MTSGLEEDAGHTELAHRVLPSGDQSGTPPEDRPFRPDVLGLRAVAVMLVVIVHARFSFFPGGFIGVDVFFVISGFVITGVLLREHATTGGTNVVAFYGRRARRIIPAAIAVLVISMVAERLIVGKSAAEFAAGQAQWASIFLADFPHGESILRPTAAPFGAYWSLAVEEQFYLLYPILFVLGALSWRRVSFRLKLSVVLTSIAASSFVWSVISSRGAGFLVAYISPLTHAWELAIGGLLAIVTSRLMGIPPRLAACMSWLGLAAIIAAACLLKSPLDYPGYRAALPVLGAALIIAGGAAAPRWGAEFLLRQFPFKWLGLLSFSLYLWHYPVIIIAGQHWQSTTQPVNLLLAVLAIVLAAGTYFAIEKPVRHSALLTRLPVLSVTVGVALIVAGLLLIEVTGFH